MSIPNSLIVQYIWQQSGGSGTYAFLATMHRPEGQRRGQWTDYGFRVFSDGGWPLDHQPHQYDLFFSPLRFKNNARANDEVVNPGVLFADLDDAPTEYEIPPSILWETSPGNRQAVWLLNRTVEDYSQWSKLNQRMTRFTKADSGGWMGSKVLRVPGSVNWKRAAFGQVLYCHKDIKYDVEWLEDKLPVIHVPQSGEPTDHPVLLGSDHIWRSLVSKHWEMMSLKARSMLTKKRVPDRSLHIVRTAYDLLSTLDAETTFHLLWGAWFNKWRTDRHAPEQLWLEVKRAEEALKNPRTTM